MRKRKALVITKERGKAAGSQTRDHSGWSNTGQKQMLKDRQN